MLRHLPAMGLLLAMILWASSFIALKIAFRTYDPMVVIFGRMAVASVCFLVMYRWIRTSIDFRAGDLKYILLMAFCEPCLYFIFEAEALVHTTASQAGMVTSMLPILVALSAGWFLKERVERRTWIGSLLAVIGVFWLTIESVPSMDAPNPLLGNFYELIAMVCATGYTITLKHLADRYSPFFLTATQAFAGSIFFLPFLFLPSTQLPVVFNPSAGMAVIYLGAVITLGAYGLYNFGVKHIPASQASAFVNLIPVFTVLMGWMLLDESFTPRQCLAAVTIMSGVFISQKRRKKLAEVPIGSN
ncbi:MAG: membrane protein [Desulfatitalea sp. BRH_c12]|nr:MAG: membrane protein [Desulfatitalea sp. BRH_c12]